MAWKSFALGNVILSDCITAAAEIITAEIGNCVADTDAKTLTLAFGGKTYTVGVSNDKNTTAIRTGLFLNDETGEFLISRLEGKYGNSALRHVLFYAALLRVMMDDGSVELVPVEYPTTNMDYVFGFSNCNYHGTTNSVVLRPLITYYFFSNTQKYNHKLIVNMFTVNNDTIPIGSTIRVDGQDFLCVGQFMFAKL